MAYDEATAQRVRRALARRRGVVEKPLMGGLAFMVADTMCCSVSGKGGLLIRVDPDDQAALLRAPHVKPMTMGRRTMTGVVRVAPDGYRTDAALKTWLERGLAAAAARATAPARPRRKRPRAKP